MVHVTSLVASLAVADCQPFSLRHQPRCSRLSGVLGFVLAFVSLTSFAQSTNPTEGAAGLLDDLSVTGAVVAIGHHRRADNLPVNSDNESNYRADVELELPLFDDGIGNHNLLYMQLRGGQGYGISAGHPTFTGAINSTAFANRGSGDEDAHALLAQLWLQQERHVNISDDGKRYDRLEFTFGKLDPFVFFDTNAVSDDESEAFLNNVFVHNPQLDSGGDVGADEFGFTPGAVLSYAFDVNNPDRVTLAAGIFGAGEGARFKSPFSRPFSIVQLRYQTKVLMDEAAVYQAYFWNNPQAVNAFDDRVETHRGLGASVAQSVAEFASVFCRVGYQTRGQVNFDRSLTGGVVLGGSYWGRPQDRAGLAMGFLQASSEYKEANPASDKGETNLEVFYNWQWNSDLHFSPHLIFIDRPAADSGTGNVVVAGLRTKLSF